MQCLPVGMENVFGFCANVPTEQDCSQQLDLILQSLSW